MIEVKVTLTKYGNSNGVFYDLYYLNIGETYPDERTEIATNISRTALEMGVIVTIPDSADRVVIVDAGFDSIPPICEGEGLGYVIITIDKTACS